MIPDNTQVDGSCRVFHEVHDFEAATACLSSLALKRIMSANGIKYDPFSFPPRKRDRTFTRRQCLMRAFKAGDIEIHNLND